MQALEGPPRRGWGCWDPALAATRGQGPAGARALQAEQAPQQDTCWPGSVDPGTLGRVCQRSAAQSHPPGGMGKVSARKNVPGTRHKKSNGWALGSVGLLQKPPPLADISLSSLSPSSLYLLPPCFPLFSPHPSPPPTCHLVDLHTPAGAPVWRHSLLFPQPYFPLDCEAFTHTPHFCFSVTFKVPMVTYAQS